jgi:hypothetical protein
MRHTSQKRRKINKYLSFFIDMTRGYPVKITIVRKFSSEEVFGKDYYYPDGRKSTICPHFKENEEIIIDHA